MGENLQVTKTGGWVWKNHGDAQRKHAMLFAQGGGRNFGAFKLSKHLPSGSWYVMMADILSLQYVEEKPVFVYVCWALNMFWGAAACFTLFLWSKSVSGRAMSTACRCHQRQFQQLEQQQLLELARLLQLDQRIPAPLLCVSRLSQTVRGADHRDGF